MDPFQNIREILKRKEYAQFKVDPQRLSNLNYLHNKSFLTKEISNEKNLILQSQQALIRNWLNPNTKYLRLLVKHGTGTGKTIGAIATALEFVAFYKKQFRYTDESQLVLPMVAIIGFSKMMFQKELLSHPEFGFVTKEEIKEHKKLRRLAETGSMLDKNALSEFEMRIKKRLSNKYLGGYFKFFGYKEFFNRLFIFSDDEDMLKVDRSLLSEDEILDFIKKGKITLNYALIEKFANSIIICDEIHNTYNSSEMNNYGIALRTILNLYDSPDRFIVGMPGSADLIPTDIMTSTGITLAELLRNSVLRAIYMSATPINNSPTEIVDLLNLLIPLSVLGKPAEKDEYFEDPRTPKKEAFERIAKLTRGYISFLQDSNPEQFPERIFEGDVIKLPREVYEKTSDKVYNGKIIPFLKFIRCPMSPYHQKTYDAVYTGTLPPDGQTLNDLVLPNPGLNNETISTNKKKNKTTESEIGLFKTKDIKYNLINASKQWKDEYQIDLVKQQIGNTEAYVLTGDFMEVRKLSKYSTKYAQMFTDLIDHVKNVRGKVMIIHQFVKVSGVLFIQEGLRKNGFIDEFSGPIKDTMCSVCGLTMEKHGVTPRGVAPLTPKHDFKPVRFIMLHGDIDKLTMEKSIEKYNSIDNLWGENYMVLVGSKVIKESYDFSAVQREWIITAPANISTLLQMFGRPVRKDSHKDLPPEYRKVHIRIYVSTLSGPNFNKDLSYEEYKYLEKTKDYIVIQQILKIFDENAFDSVIHRDIIARGFTGHTQGISLTEKHGIESRSPKNIGIETKYELGSLYFEPAKIYDGLDKSMLNLTELHTDTFNAFFSDDEINIIIYIIKRLFIEQSNVWTYEDLWEAVKNPPFNVQVNPNLFLEDSFIIAMNILVYRESNSKTTQNAYVFTSQEILSEDSRTTDRLFDRYDKYINVRGLNHRIVEISSGQKETYYVLCPINSHFKRNYISPSSIGVDINTLNTVPDIDIDSWNRYESFENTRINITEQLKSSNISYNSMKLKFYNKYKDVPIDELPTGIEVYGIDFHVKLVEDSIRYVFNIMTNPYMPYSELHEFYFKMLYFYDKLDLLLFANHLRDTGIYKKYSMYVTESTLKIPSNSSAVKSKDKKQPVEFIEMDHKYNAFLMTSMIKTSGVWDFQIDRLNRLISKSRETITSENPQLAKKASLEEISITQELKKAKEGKHKIVKVFDTMLPVGHFMTGLDNPGSKGIGTISVPKLYVPEDDNWEVATEFVQAHSEKQEENIQENDIIVGYYEKNISGINIKFKLRPPAQKIVHHEDTRMIERGATCSTKKKEELIEIARKLNIDLDSNGVKNICDAIKLELMSRELKERRKAKHSKSYASLKSSKSYASLKSSKQTSEKRIKWFYFHFEKQLE